MKKLSFAAILLALCAAGWAQGPDNAPPSDQPPQAGQQQGQWGKAADAAAPVWPGPSPPLVATPSQ